MCPDGPAAAMVRTDGVAAGAVSVCVGTACKLDRLWAAEGIRATVLKGICSISGSEVLDNKTSRVFLLYRLTDLDSCMTEMGPARQQTSTHRTSRWMLSQRPARPSRMWT